ncbi:hypothetical protein SAMN05661093_07947 [Kibdelosporangium aridum]|uniref:Uncharacterized protein n=1 Tax=Kibdelosporangium aridum TaxID=2030 RepID=A0A1Y5Y3I4_KIBAR|nr:hypothetical protein SAMN05661093_07947 [Kibdelosporangium aridum]
MSSTPALYLGPTRPHLTLPSPRRRTPTHFCAAPKTSVPAPNTTSGPRLPLAYLRAHQLPHHTKPSPQPNLDPSYRHLTEFPATDADTLCTAPKTSAPAPSPHTRSTPTSPILYTPTSTHTKAFTQPNLDPTHPARSTSATQRLRIRANAADRPATGTHRRPRPHLRAASFRAALKGLIPALASAPAHSTSLRTSIPPQSHFAHTSPTHLPFHFARTSPQHPPRRRPQTPRPHLTSASTTPTSTPAPNTSPTLTSAHPPQRLHLRTRPPHRFLAHIPHHATLTSAPPARNRPVPRLSQRRSHLALIPTNTNFHATSTRLYPARNLAASPHTSPRLPATPTSAPKASACRTSTPSLRNADFRTRFQDLLLCRWFRIVTSQSSRPWPPAPARWSGPSALRQRLLRHGSRQVHVGAFALTVRFSHCGCRVGGTLQAWTMPSRRRSGRCSTRVGR